MTKYKIEFFVGLFFILGFISFMILLLQITETKNIYKKEKNYKITAEFKNIGNLKEKSRVTIGGVKIGKVNSIKLKKNLNNEYYPEVEMFINEEIKEIPIDSSINILMSGLLGENYIQIELGNEEKFFKNGDRTVLTTQAIVIEDLISKFAFNNN